MTVFPQIGSSTGSHDGHGAGDHDVPYAFGWRPRASVPYPFSTRQYARLLLLRSRIHAGVVGADDTRREDSAASSTDEVQAAPAPDRLGTPAEPTGTVADVSHLALRR
jgi:hypothetical protein